MIGHTPLGWGALDGYFVSTMKYPATTLVTSTRPQGMTQIYRNEAAAIQEAERLRAAGAQGAIFIYRVVAEAMRVPGKPDASFFLAHRFEIRTEGRPLRLTEEDDIYAMENALETPEG